MPRITFLGHTRFLYFSIRTARYLWRIPYASTSSLERLLHEYYYELTKLLCDSSTSIHSLSDNFDEEIFEFINERGSYPGIPLFHTYRQHQLSSFDDGFISPQLVHNQLTNVSLIANCRNHIVYHENDEESDEEVESDDEEEDYEALKEKLSKIYRTEEALEEALSKLNIDRDGSSAKRQSVKQRDNEEDSGMDREFDLESLCEEPLPIYLESGMYIYHGDDVDNIEDILSRRTFEPNLVSDFVDINAADWNRLFHWTLITQTPIGYIECADERNAQKLKATLDKMLCAVDEEVEYLDLLNSYRAAQCFRVQSNNDISLWKVLEAKELTF